MSELVKCHKFGKTRDLNETSFEDGLVVTRIQDQGNVIPVNLVGNNVAIVFTCGSCSKVDKCNDKPKCGRC